MFVSPVAQRRGGGGTEPLTLALGSPSWGLPGWGAVDTLWECLPPPHEQGWLHNPAPCEPLPLACRGKGEQSPPAPDSVPPSWGLLSWREPSATRVFPQTLSQAVLIWADPHRGGRGGFSLSLPSWDSSTEERIRPCHLHKPPCFLPGFLVWGPDPFFYKAGPARQGWAKTTLQHVAPPSWTDPSLGRTKIGVGGLIPLPPVGQRQRLARGRAVQPSSDREMPSGTWLHGQTPAWCGGRTGVQGLHSCSPCRWGDSRGLGTCARQSMRDGPHSVLEYIQ